MNVTFFSKNDYEKIRAPGHRKNKPNFKGSHAQPMGKATMKPGAQENITLLCKTKPICGSLNEPNTLFNNRL